MNNHEVHNRLNNYALKYNAINHDCTHFNDFKKIIHIITSQYKFKQAEFTNSDNSISAKLYLNHRYFIGVDYIYDKELDTKSSIISICSEQHNSFRVLSRTMFSEEVNLNETEIIGLLNVYKSTINRITDIYT